MNTSASAVEPAIARSRVLVVDDNHDITLSLEMLLDMLGQDARVAHDGPTALAIAQEFRPDIVLLDLGLPGMDGYEVARALRKLPGGAAIRIVALSGWGDPTSRALSAAAGFDQHWLKPIGVAELTACLTSKRVIA